MKKLYSFLFLTCLFFLQASAQQTNCTAALEFKDSISYSPFAHYVTLKAKGTHPENKIIKKVCWRFGDGTEECKEATPRTNGEALLSITHKYSTTSAALVTYNACVIITYDGGCVADKCITFSLQYPNTISCGANVKAQSMNSSSNSFLFSAIPENINGARPLQVCWKFGDGSPDECRTYASTYTGTYIADHRFAAPGTYEVCAVIKYDGGCEARKCIAVTVAGTNTSTCSVGLRSETAASTSLLQYLIAIPENSQQKKPVEVCWRFGDGSGPVCKTYATTYTGTYVISHTYPHAGQYEACVDIKYDGGCVAHKCTLISIAGTNTPTECGAGIKIEPTLLNSKVKHIIAIPNHPQQKKPVEICWKFGDGSNDVCKTYGADYTGSYSVEHQFPQAGKYEVCIIIKYADGCSARKCEVVTIESPTNCEVKLGEVAATISTLERRFYVGMMSNRRAEKICWNFGDGSNQTCVTIPNPATEQSLTIGHKFPGPGVYRVCAKVWYADGCVADRCIEVVIRSMAPATCGGYMTHEVRDQHTVAFKGFAIPASNDPSPTYSWTFGDGGSATGQETKHKYPGPGSYQVCLVIRTNNGCETKICQKVVIEGHARPQLILSPNPATVLLHAQFFSTRTETVNIRIYNANGLLVKSLTKAVVMGENKWDFEIGTLPLGVYSVVVQSNFQFANAIFFKQ